MAVAPMARRLVSLRENIGITLLSFGGDTASVAIHAGSPPGGGWDIPERAPARRPRVKQAARGQHAIWGGWHNVAGGDNRRRAPYFGRRVPSWLASRGR